MPDTHFHARDFQLAEGQAATRSAARRVRGDEVPEGRRGQDLLVGMAMISGFIFDALDGRIARWRRRPSSGASSTAST